MKKKTIVIVSLTLVLALLVVAIIATFPSYLIDDIVPDSIVSIIQSGSITEKDNKEDDNTTNSSSENAKDPESNNDKDTIGNNLQGLVGDDVLELPGNNDNKEDDKGNSSDGVEGVLPIPDDEELGYSETPIEELETLAQTKDVKVLAEYGAFPDGTKVEIKELGILNKSYYQVRYYIDAVSRKFMAYDFSATLDNETVSPIATVKLSFAIPKGFNSENLAVYYLLENGITELDYKISDDGKTATVKVNQTGIYILAEKINDPDNTSSDNTSTESNKDNSNETSNPNTSSEQNSSNASSDTSSESTSSDSASSVDPNKETMNGWTPWH